VSFIAALNHAYVLFSERTAVSHRRQERKGVSSLEDDDMNYKVRF
jgi:hypothetical protein